MNNSVNCCASNKPQTIDLSHATWGNWKPDILLDYTTQSDTTQLTQPHHNCIDTWARRTASATSRFVLFLIWIQSPLSHNVTFVYLIRVNSTVIVPKLIITRLLWAPAGYEKPKPCGTEETYSPNPIQVPLPYGG